MLAKKRPKILVNLVREICGQSNKINIRTKNLKLAYVIECLYNVSGQRLIMPLSFLVTLYSQQLSRCKAVNKMIAILSPGGSYQHISNWLFEATSKCSEFPPGDAKVMLDNAQKIGKTGRLSLMHSSHQA